MKNVEIIVYLLSAVPPPRNSRSTAFTNRIIRVIRGSIAPFGQCSWQQKHRMQCGRSKAGLPPESFRDFGGHILTQTPQPTHFAGSSTGFTTISL